MFRNAICFALSALVLTAVAHAADADPLAKFSDEDLIKIDFCFEKFSAAVSAKDAKLAAAFIYEMPKGMDKLDLNKEADKTKLLGFLKKFEGASITGSQRLPGGVGQILYTDKAGKSQEQRMQNQGGRWKISL